MRAILSLFTCVSLALLAASAPSPAVTCSNDSQFMCCEFMAPNANDPIAKVILNADGFGDVTFDSSPVGFNCDFPPVFGVCSGTVQTISACCGTLFEFEVTFAPDCSVV